MIFLAFCVLLSHVGFSSQGKIMTIIYLVRRWTKSSIIKLALWGLLPIKLANWLIQRGGLRHD
jgi:hypothetical protein